MGFLTEEEKTYILGAVKQWDGKSVYDRCNQITKNCQSAFEDIIWLLENIDSYRKAMDREFMTKYRGDRKPPKRPVIDGEKFVKVNDLERFIGLYIKSMSDSLWWESYLNSGAKPHAKNQVRANMDQAESEVKIRLMKAIAEIKLERPV